MTSTKRKPRKKPELLWLRMVGAQTEAAVLRFCVWFCLYCDNNKMWVGGLNLDLALSVCPTIIGKAEKTKKK